MSVLIQKDPFFIFYEPRSGSTFLANLLIKHYNVVIPPESSLIPLILTDYGKQYINSSEDLTQITTLLEQDVKFGDWHISTEKIYQYFKDKYPISIKDFICYILQVYQQTQNANAEILGVKKGSYAKHYSKLKTMFPNTKFIGLIRDGRGVFNSQKNSLYSKTNKPFETNPRRAAQKWCNKLLLLKEIEQKYSQATLIVHYEDLIKDTENTIDKIANFLQIKTTHNSSLEKNASSYEIGARYGDLHKNIEKKPIAFRINAWQNSLSAEEIYAFETVAAKCLESEGYELVNSSIAPKNSLQQKLKSFIKYFSVSQ